MSRILLVSANRERLPAPVVPLGLLSIASVLRERQHTVDVVDMCFESDPNAALARSVEATRPDVVGIGIRNLHTNTYAASDALIDGYRSLVDTVRATSTAPVVLGGAGFSLQPERMMNALGADAGVVGEGEWTTGPLVEALARGEVVPRLVTSSSLAPDRVALRMPKGRSDEALDSLPWPARDLADPRYYAFDGVENVQTKRGCAFACAYCDYPDLEGHFVRVRDPKTVAAEVVARAVCPGVSHVFFVDSVFNVPRWHAMAVCEALRERGAPLPWVCYASPVGLDDAMVEAMASAGCVGMELGSDSGTDRMLARLKKPFRASDIVRAHALCRAHGIADCHTFVLGAMDETADEVRETLDFIDRLDPDVAVFIVFMEDREQRAPHRARHREGILELLAREAPSHAGWSVPELGIRFGEKLMRFMQRRGARGPAWLHLARVRRAADEANRKLAG